MLQCMLFSTHMWLPNSCKTAYIQSVLQGMLGIGAAMLGSSHVIGIDIDTDALQTAQENCDQYEGLQVE